MRWTRNDVHDGMSVTSTKGDRLGKVISRSAETFVVEKGVFFPKDYELRYDHITDMGSGGITYSLSDIESRLGRRRRRGGHARRGPRRHVGASTARLPPRAPRHGLRRAARPVHARPRTETSSREELRIPLMEEEIGIEKVSRETGHVRSTRR